MIGENGHKILEIVSNSLLFLSTLLLLIDVAPRDLFPGHRERVRALVLLKEKKNILGTLPLDVNVRPGTEGMSIVRDEDAFRVLIELIRRESAQARSVEWDHAVGVGYAAISIPIAGTTLEAFRRLYVVLMPKDGGTRFRLTPVGQLEDVDSWLYKSHQGSLTATALALLMVGFFLQLCATFTLSKAMTEERRRLHRQKGDNMKLEKKDRLILANQYRILELLDKQNASERQKHCEIVEGGFEGLYDDILGQVIDEDTVTEAECNEVIDTLSMFRALKQSFAKLDDTNGIDEHLIKFDGYDGNDETKFMAFARFFCERLGRFEELDKGDGFNSHCPMRPVYNRMRSVWNSLPSDAKYNLSKGQIRDIAAAARLN